MRMPWENGPLPTHAQSGPFPPLTGGLVPLTFRAKIYHV